jgi:tRNA modification GTPase
MQLNTTICALATGGGTSALAVIRVSGPDALLITDKIFIGKKSKKLAQQKGYTLHFGNIYWDNQLIDEVLVSVFKQPHSYTGENLVEISCHGSIFIQQSILSALQAAGAKAAKAGEFTLRSFLNGKIDLSQAEAVADIIASENKAAHTLAFQQLRGGYSDEIKKLRAELMTFAALIELELDFSTEDVEFADRTQLKTLIDQLIINIKLLRTGFTLGNVIKSGIPVAIVGKPNAGKSTLLNALLKEEKAIVSSIAGTTRDAIEDVLVIDGTAFRFIDTAGLRETQDEVEKIGIERSYLKMQQASIILYLFDANEMNSEDVKNEIYTIKASSKTDQVVIPVANKTDITSEIKLNEFASIDNLINLSAKNNEGIEILKNAFTNWIISERIKSSDMLVSNARHAHSLEKAEVSLVTVIDGLQNQIPSDLLATDIRAATEALSEITGEVTNDELLGIIFGKFCIGK